MEKVPETVSAALQDFDVPGFQDALLRWFGLEGRAYPWRETADPYAILVSELMLQQTRIATVLNRGYYHRWMRAFPDWKSLAEASEEEILKLWEGLGYYNRARNLQKTARVVVADHDGEFPDTLKEVMALPGVGRYTAGAVLSFAFNQSVPVVDGNVVRVMSRILNFSEPVNTPKAMAGFWDWAEALTPGKQAGAFNSAIMELGQTICRNASPDCEGCPVQGFCRAYMENTVDALPVKKAARKVTRLNECVILLVKEGNILLATEKGNRRKGMWRLPEVREEEVADFEECFRFDYAITRYKVNLRAFVPDQAFLRHRALQPEEKWFSLKSGENLPAMGAPYKKAIRKFTEISQELLFPAEFEGDRKQKIG